jgi:drug/metabolite transporter (DMT)-like permease
MPNATSNQSPAPKSRGWSLVAAGFLLLALALVVIYTSRSAFLSPLALVVVASIGLAALLLQLRMRKDVDRRIHAPIWLNVLGLLFAIGAVIADFLHVSANFMIVAALGAVVCFAVSGATVLDALRKRKD